MSVHVRPAEIRDLGELAQLRLENGRVTAVPARRCTGCRTPRRCVSTSNARLMADDDNVLLVAGTGI